MTRKHSFRSALAAGVCLLPLAMAAPALAQDDSFDVGDKPAEATTPPPQNWFDVGGAYQTSRSYYLDRYRGSPDAGFSGIGGLHYVQRDPWDSGGTTYFQVDGRNLGYSDRSFEARAGQQGLFGLSFSYDGIPYYATNSFQSAYQPSGFLTPNIAPGSLSVAYGLLLPKNGLLNSLWIPLATNKPTLYNMPLSSQRDIYTLGGKYQVGDWMLSASWKHEHKDGVIANSLAIGGAPGVTSAGSGANKPTSYTSGLAYFPQPIDYDTDRFEAVAAFTTRRLQAQISYVFSEFTDNTAVFKAQNPFNFFSTSLASSYTVPVGGITANFVLPPSNSAHQIKLQLGYSPTDTTRINANLGAGLNLQNAAFVSGIGANASSAQNLPRLSFNGEVDNLFGNLSFVTQPFEHADLRVAYTIDDRNNRSPQNSYLVFPVSTNNTSFTYSNLPFSYRHQTVSVEGGYRLGNQTKVTVGDTFEDTHRTYADTSLVTSNRIGAKIRGPLMDDLFGTLSIAHEDRWAQNYSSQGWWKAACNGCSVEPSNFLMFFQSSRKHDEARGTLDFSPDDNLSTSLVAKFAKDTYPAGNYGLRNNTNFTIGPDVSWHVSKDVTMHAYYSYQQIYYNQSSIYQSPGAPATPAPTASNTQYSVPYTVKSTDSVQTVGANVDWDVIPGKLKLALDYNFSYGDTAYALGEGVVAYGGAITSPTFGPSITSQVLPDVKSMLSVISVHGEYTIMPDVTLMFGYAWERFTYKDFLVGTSSTQYANALLPGTLAPNDSVHVVSASLRVRF